MLGLLASITMSCATFDLDTSVLRQPGKRIDPRDPLA
jgi:hypothetical protein